MIGVWDEKCMISPSLICLDMLDLRRQIRQFEDAGIQLLHVDILDGHFSPSMPLGFETVKQIRRETTLKLECHVMADPPEYFVDELLQIGVDQIVFHIETAAHVDGLLNRIHAAGIRAGVALKPATSLTVLDYVLEKCDAVLLMQINPGYASNANEHRIEYMPRKIRELRRIIDERGLPTKIILDGRVSRETIMEFGKDTADIFVGGTTCIDSKNIARSVEELMQMRAKIVG